VSVRTREHVTKVIQDLGFVPNKLAGALSQTRSNQVSVLIPSLVNNVFSQVLRGITEELAKAGYNPVVGVTNYEIPSTWRSGLTTSRRLRCWSTT